MPKKQQNQLNQSARHVVGRATGENLELVGFPKERLMRVYPLIHTVVSGYFWEGGIMDRIEEQIVRTITSTPHVHVKKNSMSITFR